ncbi:MAG: glycosyltransferase [Patescibacteria group bacterium]|nr:glycosyltransferase [Patescibacteria group bacterium]
MSFSPIVLFVYNRPEHTKKTIEALQKNKLAKDSELFIYSDGPKNEENIKKVNEVRKYINTIEGFKKVKIVEREKNSGLARSIIEGVTEIVNKYGKIIVLEDDIVTAPYFLKFMNDALEFYKDEKKVWHISGWNYPLDIKNNNDVFAWRVMNCWGWATWDDRWKYFEKNTDKLIKSFSKENKKAFDLDGVGGFWQQILDNKNKKIDTWAIFWYATIFKSNGLCINTTKSFVKNVGLDGSGVHCGNTDVYIKEFFKFDKDYFSFLPKICEDTVVVNQIKDFYLLSNPHRSLFKRIINKVNILKKINIKKI